jgi:hypothetical protein
MSNDWYENTKSLAKGTNARAEDVEAKFDAIEVGFDLFPDKADLMGGKIAYGVSTGAANAYLLTLSNVTAYADGLEIVFKANHANTGEATINVNSLGVISLRRQNGDALAAGDIPENKIVSFRYNSTSKYFEMQLITAGNMTDVATVAGISTDVSAVAGISTDVSAVAAIDSDVTTVAGNDANVTTVSGISANVTTVAGISTDVSAVAAIDSDVTTVAGISDDVSTVADMGDSFRKVFRRSIFTYNGDSTAYTIKVGGGWYYVKDKLAKWTSELTTGAISSPVADTHYYLYLDYSAITSGTNITASELIWSSTAPSYSYVYGGWYNGDDRCIFAVTSNAVPSNIYAFNHDGGDCIYWESDHTLVYGCTPSDSYCDVDASLYMPSFSTIGYFTAYVVYVDGEALFRIRTNGRTDGYRTLYTHTNSERVLNSLFVPTDSSQIIEIGFNAARNNTVNMFIIGWCFPGGM